jgi:uncharacterized protein with PQ loop repeat
MDTKTKKARTLFSVYIVVIGTIGQLAPYFQAYKTFTTHSAGDLSIIASSIVLVSILSWLTYGFMIKDYPLIISSIIGSIGASVLITGILMYG